MNPKDSDFGANEMIALRGHEEALRAITEKLRVKEMGPADHIRTKHEVKAWLEAGGDTREAEAIVVRARARRELQQTQSVTRKLTQRQNQRQSMGD
jgi:hypothetical protein